MRIAILLAYLATFAVSIGSLIAIALLAATDSFVPDSFRGGQFFLALGLGLSIAAFAAFRIRRWRWPHLTAIIIGPLIAVAFFWISEDLVARSQRSSNLVESIGLGLDALFSRTLMVAAGLWFIAGNLGIALRAIDPRCTPAMRTPSPHA